MAADHATCCSAVRTAPTRAIPSGSALEYTRRSDAAAACRSSAASAPDCSLSWRRTARSTRRRRSDGQSSAASGSTSASTARATGTGQCRVRCSSTLAWCASSSPRSSRSRVCGRAQAKRWASSSQRPAVSWETRQDPASSITRKRSSVRSGDAWARSARAACRRSRLAHERASSTSSTATASMSAFCARPYASSSKGSVGMLHRTCVRTIWRASTGAVPAATPMSCCGGAGARRPAAAGPRGAASPATA